MQTQAHRPYAEIPNGAMVPHRLSAEREPDSDA